MKFIEDISKQPVALKLRSNPVILQGPPLKDLSRIVLNAPAVALARCRSEDGASRSHTPVISTRARNNGRGGAKALRDRKTEVIRCETHEVLVGQGVTWRGAHVGPAAHDRVLDTLIMRLATRVTCRQELNFPL